MRCFVVRACVCVLFIRQQQIEKLFAVHPGELLTKTFFSASLVIKFSRHFSIQALIASHPFSGFPFLRRVSLSHTPKYTCGD